MIYARYSSHAQREASIEDQVRECTAAAAAAGDRIVGVYADRAVSGRRADRDQLLKMMADAKKSQWSRVWVWKVDRFARSRLDAAIFKSALKKGGIDMRYAAEQIPDGPMGIIVEALLEAMAEYYSANLAENTRRGKEGNALKCHPNGQRRFGYRLAGARIEDGVYVPNDHYEIEPDEAAAVRVGFASRSRGATLDEIAARMVDMGVVNCSGQPHNRRSVFRMLCNEMYLGVYFHGDVRIEGGVPRIVTYDEWIAAHTAAIRGQPSRTSHLRDISGECFGGWTAVEHVRTDKLHRWYWTVRHVCGHEAECTSADLASGRLPLCPVCDNRAEEGLHEIHVRGNSG